MRLVSLRFHDIPNLLSRMCSPKVKDQNYLKKYLSDFSENKYPKREFFYIILQTLFPKELETNIKASRKHRALDKMKNKNELIK